MNDTSDEAFKEWYDEEAVPNIELLSTYSTAEFSRAAWAEAVRRCEAQMEERERMAFQAAFLAQWDEISPLVYLLRREDEAWRAFKKEMK